MSEQQQWTKEPWFVGNYQPPMEVREGVTFPAEVTIHAGATQQGVKPTLLRVIAAGPDGKDTRREALMDQAYRITACVQSCKGLADPEAEIAALREQRDALLDALKRINAVEIGDVDHADFDAFIERGNIARIAIALCQPSAQS